MKVIHIIKRIETIDDDIRELRKLEKSLVKNKSFSTPIYMSIEKQINILLGDRIKLLELKIENPPENIVKEIEGDEPVEIKPAKQPAKKSKKPSKEIEIELDDDDITILSQDIIDEKFERLKQEHERDISENKSAVHLDEEDLSNENVKLLDVALEKGTLNKTEIEKEKKKVKFFKDNFPGGEY